MNKALDWEATIGIEVHVQLSTQTKLFCRCACEFGAPPNTRVCPVCLGHPGVLPVLNSAAVQQGARAALALTMAVQEFSKFDRKNYFYPDLPKGYQISQFDQPIGLHGEIVLDNGRKIGIQRLHLEEDAGKTIHDRGEFALVDFNRAGTPLAEIVSEPDIRTATEAKEYLEKLKQAMQYAGVSDCDMEKGNLRCDLNVSVAPPGQRTSGTRTEIKNVNSFNSAQKAIDFEIARQIRTLEGGGSIRQETRTWDEIKEETRVMRVKEEADDYRYFPEPDLPPLRLSSAWIQAQQESLPEGPIQRRGRYQSDLGLSEFDAGVLTADVAIADYFEALLEEGIATKEAANWVGNELLSRLAGDQAIRDLGIEPQFLAGCLRLLRDRKTNRNGVKTILDAKQNGDSKNPEELLRELGLELNTDTEALTAVCQQAVQALPKAASDVREGKQKALGALLGFVMKETGGAADPGTVRRLLLEMLQTSA